MTNQIGKTTIKIRDVIIFQMYGWNISWQPPKGFDMSGVIRIDEVWDGEELIHRGVLDFDAQTWVQEA